MRPCDDARSGIRTRRYSQIMMHHFALGPHTRTWMQLCHTAGRQRGWRPADNNPGDPTCLYVVAYAWKQTPYFERG